MSTLQVAMPVKIFTQVALLVLYQVRATRTAKELQAFRERVDQLEKDCQLRDQIHDRILRNEHLMIKRISDMEDPKWLNPGVAG